MRWLIAIALVAGCVHGPELLYAWNRIDYDFASAADARAYAAGVYAKTLLAGVDVDRRGRVFVTTPRWLDARVPATLSEVVIKDSKPVLRAFPSWQANRVGDRAALQSVLGVEIDKRDRMWILDMGWVASTSGDVATPDGAQKLVVIDLATDRELARYEIPDAVANRTTSFLNDLAVDADRGIAYISDSGNRSGSPTASGIIVYDLATNSARRVLDRDPRVQDDPSRTLYVEGERVLPNGRLAVGINGIALSPDGSRLYWSITTGDAIYDAPTNNLVASAVHGPRRIGGGSDGITVGRDGRVFATSLSHDAVIAFDPERDGEQTIASGPDFAWPDSMSWDREGRLYVSTNHLNHGFAGTLDFTKPNFRIFRIDIK